MTSIPANVDLSALGIYNAKNFGAVGDGVTDDSPAIQNAINAAFVAGGGIVYLPSAKYLLKGGTIMRGTKPGDTTGATCSGLAPIPSGVQFASHTTNNYFGPNCPSTFGPGGTLPAGMLPNGPLLLFDNVILMGDGPEQTILLAGENFYGGWLFSPTGPVGGPAQAQLGIVIASMNYWADYLSDATNFPDGYFAKKVYVRNLSIDCQGKLGVNAGQPSQIIVLGVPQPNLRLQLAQDGSPDGQLYGACVTLHSVLDCGVDNVWVYDGNVNGILLDGTQKKQAHTNGPLPQSFQQQTTVSGLSNLFVFVPNTVSSPVPTTVPPNDNVPVVNGFITNCQVDMNYPAWLAGSVLGLGGSNGQLPIRAVGCAAVVVAFNRVGQRNQPSSFPTPPPSTFNPPNVSPNTNDAMDCPGAWHILIFGNTLTNCGDGIGSDGNGDIVVACNVIYNFGGVGFLAPSSTGKSASQAIIFGNTIFLGSDFGTFQQGIAFVATAGPTPNPNDALTATPGSVVIANNVIYGSAYNIMVEIQVNGVTIQGNIFDYGGVQPNNQPTAFAELGVGTSAWPLPTGVGIDITANDIIAEGNIFRNAQVAGTPNLSVVGIRFPTAFPPTVSPDTIRVLIKGNIFDKTIGSPITDNSHGTDGLLGVRILDNIGANPPGTLSTSLVPFPSSGATFANPYAYDCFVTVACGASANITRVTLNGVITGATITSNNQKSFLVKAGAIISILYTGSPTWVWVGL